MAESRRSLLGFVAVVLAVSVGSQVWGWHQEKQLGIKLATAARPGDIQMLASDTCSYCAGARAFMQTHAVPFTECSIERDSACAARYEALKSPGTPVLLVRGEVQLGFMPRRVLERLSSG
ncbi:MAG: hypothetical protein HY855_03255 [Burkholderiales bacterium]|nr:hypothetical protein [Burkholderiales bacterium]